MAGDWTSMYAIMQDLSVAQGGAPMIVGDIVKANDKPPTPVIEDEVPEEYYQNVCASGDYLPPDLGLIQEMLKMVRTQDITVSENDSTTKLDTDKPDIETTDNAKSITLDKTMKTNHRKPSRNVAITSLLKIEHDKNQKKLSNASLYVSQTENGLTNGLSSNKNKYTVKLAPGNMFKKKSPQRSPEKKSLESRLDNVASPTCGEYKPSSMASEYYKAYMEKNKTKELLQEDIWSRAEKQMKEIDARRKQERLSSPPENPQTSPAAPSRPNISPSKSSSSESPSTSESSSTVPSETIPARSGSQSKQSLAYGHF